MNAEPNSQAVRFLSEQMTDAWYSSVDDPTDGLTFPSWDPIKRIDFIFFKGDRLNINDVALHGLPQSKRPRPSNVISDHLALSASFSISELDPQNTY